MLGLLNKGILSSGGFEITAVFLQPGSQGHKWAPEIWLWMFRSDWSKSSARSSFGCSLNSFVSRSGCRDQICLFSVSHQSRTTLRGGWDVREGGMRRRGGEITLRPSCPFSLRQTHPVSLLDPLRALLSRLLLAFRSLSCLLIPRSSPSFLLVHPLCISQSPSLFPRSTSFHLPLSVSLGSCARDARVWVSNFST